MKRMRVLVVDDDRDFAEGLADVLAIKGHQVDTALNGDEAVARFGEQGYDLAFIDIKMRRKNGLETFLEIRREHPSGWKGYRDGSFLCFPLKDDAGQAIGAVSVSWPHVTAKMRCA